jgi:hypothetical protein
MDISTILRYLPTIFMGFIFLCLGASIGALIQRSLDRRTPAPPRLAPTPEPPGEHQLAAEGELEILRLWRTQAGKLWLEMDGERLEGRESLQSDQRRRLVGMLVELRPWLENTPPAAAAEAKPLQAVGAVKPPRATAPETPQAKPVVVLKSIVEQIDDVLQARLKTSPFRTRDIHLVEGLGGVVLVKDGLNKYEGIEAVPELEIQAFIRQAITEWEKSTR